jgi:very-short-patch-repair endonuclease
VARWQLTDLQIGSSTIDRRRATGQLHGIHAGVYAIGHPGISRHGRWMAATLACGRGAMVSGRSAAGLHSLSGDQRDVVDITIPRDCRLDHDGIKVHRSLCLTRADLDVQSRIPVTALARTLLDIAAVSGEGTLREAIGAAQRRRTLDVDALQELIERSYGHRGVALLREVASDLRPDGRLARREFERRFLSLSRRHGLPEPVVNGLIQVGSGALQVDFHWPAARLVVETDGYAFHSDIHSHEEDRRRDQELKLAGWEVLRFTWQQLTRQPVRTMTIVARMLERRMQPTATPL